ncbi:MAG: hypothetical protein K2K75_13820 [Muribaculaceae bacterium]|nr:hypothetical protein [Muribaculaceae bacterium]
MKKLLNSLLLIFTLVSISACKSDLDSLEDGNHRSQRIKNKQMVKTVRMSFGGDFITESEEPLLRAEDGDVYTGINVFWTEKNKENAPKEKYAYGLFKRKDNIEIKLVTGYTYEFVATILVEGDDKLYLNPQYGEPFVVASDEEYKESSSLGYPKDSLNRFIYTYNLYQAPYEEYNKDNNRRYFRRLTSGYSLVETGGDGEYESGTYRNPRVKRFYGFSNSFDPGISDTVRISMGYKCFGLKIIVDSISGGELTVEDVTKYSSNGYKPELAIDKLVFPKSLVFTKEGTTVWEGKFSMNGMSSDAETFDLNFHWDKGNGDTDNFPCHIEVHPKMKKVLKLKINGTINQGTKGNIVFSMDTEDMDDEAIQEVIYDSDKN